MMWIIIPYIRYTSTSIGTKGKERDTSILCTVFGGGRITIESSKGTLGIGKRTVTKSTRSGLLLLLLLLLLYININNTW